MSALKLSSLFLLGSLLGLVPLRFLVTVFPAQRNFVHPESAEIEFGLGLMFTVLDILLGTVLFLGALLLVSALLRRKLPEASFWVVLSALLGIITPPLSYVANIPIEITSVFFALLLISGEYIKERASEGLALSTGKKRVKVMKEKHTKPANL